MQEKEWLTLSEYSIKYKVSVSTLRRRIKSKKVECIYEDGKYFLRNLSLNGHRLNNTGDLTHHQVNPNATIAPPQPFSSFEDVQVKNNETVEPIIQNKKDEVSADVRFMLKELKNAYTLNLKEKEEQILILKDEITDLKMLVHALEQQVDELKIGHKQNSTTQEVAIEPLTPQPIELEYIPTPNIELATDWLDDEI